MLVLIPYTMVLLRRSSLTDANRPMILTSMFLLKNTVPHLGAIGKLEI